MTTTTPPMMFVVCSIAHHYDHYACSQLYGSDNMRSARWCSAAKVDFEGQNEGFCWPHQYAAATTSLVLDAFSGICQLCYRSSTCTFLFQSWVSLWFLCYPWQAYVPHDNGLWHALGVHQVTAPPTALSRGESPASLHTVSHSLQQYGWVNSFGGSSVTWSLYLPYMVGRGFPFQVVVHLLTWLTPNLWQV